MDYLEDDDVLVEQDLSPILKNKLKRLKKGKASPPRLQIDVPSSASEKDAEQDSSGLDQTFTRITGSISPKGTVAPLDELRKLQKEMHVQAKDLSKNCEEYFTEEPFDNSLLRADSLNTTPHDECARGSEGSAKAPVEASNGSIETAEEALKVASTSSSEIDKANHSSEILKSKKNQKIPHLVANSKKVQNNTVKRGHQQAMSKMATKNQDTGGGLSKADSNNGNNKGQATDIDQMDELDDDDEALVSFLQKEAKKIKANCKISMKATSKEVRSSTSIPSKAKKPKKEHVEEIHAESQRLLRETRGVAFAPQPIIQKKSVQNVLEKIRSRKSQHLQLASNISSLSGQHPYEVNVLTVEHVKATTNTMDEVVFGDAFETRQQSGLKVGQTTLVDKDEGFALRTFGSSDNHNHKDVLRPPVEDTQDLFCNSQSISDEHLEENLVDIDYGALGMGINLHLDTETQDEELDRWCEEDLNKENCAVLSEQPIQHANETKASILKEFVDDEAEEDEDFRCESGDEDEDIDGNVDDLIAPPEEEGATECSRRSKLHRKWLEQQEEALTDDILFRLRTGCKPRILREPMASFLDENFGNGEAGNTDHHSSGSTAKNKLSPAVLGTEQTSLMGAQDGSRLAKVDVSNIADVSEQSESCEDEEVEETIFRQRLLQKTEDQETFLSPAEDDTSREVLGFINKLNVPPTKTKPATGLSDIRAFVANSNISGNSKSSFLGRAVSLSLQSSHKQGFGNSRSFIFGRDDSNSSHGFSGSENLEVTLPKDSTSGEGWNEHTKKSGEPILAARSTQISRGSASGPSLFEILKRQATDLDQSLQERNTNIMVGKGHPLKNISMFSKSFKQSRAHRSSE